MKIKDATRIVFNNVKDIPIKQTELITKIKELTGYSYESIRGNVFRNVDFIPFICKDYKKVLFDNRISYIESKSNYNHNFNKPNEYYSMLELLNLSDNIYTLIGTQSNCLKVLDRSKTITVDISSHTNPDINKDIFKIKHLENSSINLDTCGILTNNKVVKINKLSVNSILFTFRSSKCDILLDKLNFNISKKYTYKSRSSNMIIVLLKLNPPYRWV